mmetsp:Transcript_11864/g.23551  ORF Transcript_11864/g.23551 Transcript_11864/m.23551 type:complete len:211 (-) Transcript_11864:145-777(-)
MESEVLTLTSSERNSCMSKVRRYRSDLAAMKREVARSSKSVNSGEHEVEVELFGGRGGGSVAGNSWDAVGTGDTLNRSTAMLEDSRRVIAETEEIGDSVASDLEGQRSQLLNAHGRVVEIRAYMKDAKQILKNMTWRDLQQKCVLLGIIAVLILVIVLVIYYRFIKSGSSDDDDDDDDVDDSKSRSTTDEGKAYDDHLDDQQLADDNRST